MSLDQELPATLQLGLNLHGPCSAEHSVQDGDVRHTSVLSWQLLKPIRSSMLWRHKHCMTMKGYKPPEGLQISKLRELCVSCV